MDVQQAADRYRVRAPAIRRWIRDGELPRRRGRPRGIQRTRRFEWFNRIAFPGNALMGLGDASETWRDDLADEWETTSRLLPRSEEHTSELQSRENLVCRLLLE